MSGKLPELACAVNDEFLLEAAAPPVVAHVVHIASARNETHGGWKGKRLLLEVRELQLHMLASHSMDEVKPALRGLAVAAGQGCLGSLCCCKPGMAGQRSASPFGGGTGNHARDLSGSQARR